MRIPQHIMKWVMLGVMLLTMPCFVFLLACGGVLPVGGMVLLVLDFARESGALGLVMGVIFVGAHAAVYVFVFSKLAALLSRSMARASQPWHLLMLAAVIAVAAAAMFSPIYWFECTHSGSGPCTAFAMYGGWPRPFKACSVEAARRRQETEPWPKLDASAVQVTAFQVGLEAGPAGEPLAMTVAFDFQTTRNGRVDMNPSVFIFFDKPELRGGDGTMDIQDASLQPAAEPDGQHRSGWPTLVLSHIRVKGQQPYHAELKLYPQFVRRPPPPAPLCLDLDWLDQRVRRHQKPIREAEATYCLSLDREAQRRQAVLKSTEATYRISFLGLPGLPERREKLVPLGAFYEAHRQSGTPECALPQSTAGAFEEAQRQSGASECALPQSTSASESIPPGSKR